MVEEHLQDMIDRGTIMIDLEGEVVGQVNGLAVYAMGDYMFGNPPHYLFHRHGSCRHYQH